VVWLIDGVVVRTEAVSPTAPMRPGASDFLAGGQALVVDWLRMTPYVTPGTFDSRIQDAGAPVLWKNLEWNGSLPAGTDLEISVRTGNTPIPDGAWSAFAPIAAPGDEVAQIGRYLQYRASLATGDPGVTPALLDLSVRCTPPPQCLVDADCNDGNACTLDLCASGTCTHATRPDGTTCDDGNAGTCGDVCGNGVCGGTAVPEPAEVDDSVRVTGGATASTIAWTDAPGPYNVYRGSIRTTVPFAYNQGCLNPGGALVATSTTDTLNPPIGVVFFYLVTRVDACRESIPGRDSSGVANPNPNACPAPGGDADGDSVIDPLDNCPSTANTDQADADGDGVGDVCDNCPLVFNPDQSDEDGNGVGNACEPALRERPAAATPMPKQ